MGETGGDIAWENQNRNALFSGCLQANVQHCTYAWESRILLNSEAPACDLGITFFARLIAVGDDFIP